MIPVREEGQATILVLGLTMVVLGVLGITVDGTKAFIHRRTLQSVADAAALAGASELDAGRYYSSKGRVLQLDPSAARSAALRWLALRGVPSRTSVRVEGNSVVVTLRGTVPTLFLRIVGLQEVPVAVEAASAPSAVP